MVFAVVFSLLEILQTLFNPGFCVFKLRTEQVFIIPVLIGLLFELFVIVPMRVLVDESPVFLLSQDWAFGLILLEMWTRLVSISLPLAILTA